VKTLRNVSPCGALDLPLIGRTIAAGETFQVDDTAAAKLLEQAGVYELVTSGKESTATNADGGK